MPSEIFGIRPSPELRRACERKAAELGISVHELARRALTAVARGGWMALTPVEHPLTAEEPQADPSERRIVYDE